MYVGWGGGGGGGGWLPPSPLCTHTHTLPGFVKVGTLLLLKLLLNFLHLNSYRVNILFSYLKLWF